MKKVSIFKVVLPNKWVLSPLQFDGVTLENLLLEKQRLILVSGKVKLAQIRVAVLNGDTNVCVFSSYAPKVVKAKMSSSAMNFSVNWNVTINCKNASQNQLF